MIKCYGWNAANTNNWNINNGWTQTNTNSGLNKANTNTLSNLSTGMGRQITMVGKTQIKTVGTQIQITLTA